MFKYHFSDYLWLYLIAAVVWALLLLLLGWLGRRIPFTNRIYCCFVGVAFAFLGLTVGIHIGLSQSPVVGIIIPALLTFIGGFMLYVFVFSDKGKLQDGYVLLVIMISLSFFLMLGSDYASNIRAAYNAQFERYKNDQALYLEYFKSELAKGHVVTAGTNTVADSTNTAQPVKTSAADQDIFKQVMGGK